MSEPRKIVGKVGNLFTNNEEEDDTMIIYDNLTVSTYNPLMYIWIWLLHIIRSGTAEHMKNKSSKMIHYT